MSLYGTEWNDRGYGLRTIFTKLPIKYRLHTECRLYASENMNEKTKSMW
jgi:hypothetical protein